MLQHFNSINEFSLALITTILLVILSETLGENNSQINSVNHQNRNELTAEPLLSRTHPSLVGIFADNVKDEEELKYIFDNIEDINQTIALIENKRSVVSKDNTSKSRSALVPQIDDNKHNSDNQSLASVSFDTQFVFSNESNNEVAYNQTEELNLCQQIKSDQSIDEISPLTPICHLSGPSGGSAPPADPSFNNGKPVNNIYPLYFYIPEEKSPINESIDDKSYLAMKVKVCSEPSGQVLIYDVVKGQQLLSFNNKATTKMCNYWPTTESGGDHYQSFVSVSNKVMVEMILPFGEDPPLDGDLGQHQYIKKDGHDFGSRIYKYRGFELHIIYFEMKFSKITEQTLYPESTNNRNNTEIEAIYIPNSVLTFKLESEADGDKTKSLIGLNISLNYLNIDIDAGDFLVIGAGSEPTHRELSKAQVISQNIDNESQRRKIYVSADSAYIRLVTHNSNRKTGTALRFSWTPPNTTVNEIDSDNVPQRLKDAALQICVLEHSCQNMDNNFRQSFVEELVHIANQYLANTEHDITTLVSSKSVFLFSPEEGIRIHEYKSEIFCQINVVITSAFDDQWPMIPYNTLRYIFFRGSDYKIMHSFGKIKITDCSHESISFWKMILPIVVILIVSIVIMLIAWRYQHLNWMRSQRIDSPKYMQTQITDNSEDTLYEKEPKTNPIFVDVETPQPIRKSSNLITKTTDFTDGNIIINTEQIYNKQLSQTSESSAVAVNQSDDIDSDRLEGSLLANPTTSQEILHQKPLEFDHQFEDQITDTEDERDVKNDRLTRDIPNIVDRTQSSASDTMPSRISPSLTGLHGTQHESLRAYPRSVLRRPRTISQNEYLTGPESGSLRSAKVQFELPLRAQPKRSPLLEQDSSENTFAFENNAFVE